MRSAILVIAACVLLAGPAFAQGGERYDNARFGYGIDIPAGFVGQGESDNGDGQAFVVAGKPIDLLVWGGIIMEPDFESEVAAAMGYTEEAGWNLTYQATTPRWASFSGQQGSRIVYERLILLCDNQSYAAFRAEYSTTDAADMNPMIEQMVQSLRGVGC